MEKVKDMLDNIQQSLFDAAKQKRDSCVQVVKTWDEFKEALSERKMILAPWCDEEVMISSQSRQFVWHKFFVSVQSFLHYEVSVGLLFFSLCHSAVCVFFFFLIPWSMSELL